MPTQFLEAREDYALRPAPDVREWTTSVGVVLRQHYCNAMTVPQIWAYRFDDTEFLNCDWNGYCLGFALQAAQPRLPPVEELFGADCGYRSGDVPVHDMTDALMLFQLIEQSRCNQSYISLNMAVPCKT